MTAFWTFSTLATPSSCDLAGVCFTSSTVHDRETPFWALRPLPWRAEAIVKRVTAGLQEAELRAGLRERVLGPAL